MLCCMVKLVRTDGDMCVHLLCLPQEFSGIANNLFVLVCLVLVSEMRAAEDAAYLAYCSTLSKMLFKDTCTYVEIETISYSPVDDGKYPLFSFGSLNS